MRISDWSSDVCSSDLLGYLLEQGVALVEGVVRIAADSRLLLDRVVCNLELREEPVKRVDALLDLVVGALANVLQAVGCRVQRVCQILRARNRRCTESGLAGFRRPGLQRNAKAGAKRVGRRLLVIAARHRSEGRRAGKGCGSTGK